MNRDQKRTYWYKDRSQSEYGVNIVPVGTRGLLIFIVSLLALLLGFLSIVGAFGFPFLPEKVAVLIVLLSVALHFYAFKFKTDYSNRAQEGYRRKSDTGHWFKFLRNENSISVIPANRIGLIASLVFFVVILADVRGMIPVAKYFPGLPKGSFLCALMIVFLLIIWVKTDWSDRT